MRNRVAIAIIAGSIPLLAGVVVGFATHHPAFGIPAGFAAAVLVVTLSLGAPAYQRIAILTAVVSVVTLTATLLHLKPSETAAANLLGLVELAALMWMIILLTRSAPVKQLWVVAPIAVIAEVTMILRTFSPQTAVDVVVAMAIWSLGSISAILGGLYLRSLETRRSAAIEVARRNQRLDLARDLHDFVAHDVSGIVVQAQAAQVVAAQDPMVVMDALKRIEEAGLDALKAMDRTVHMLRDSSEGDSDAADRAPIHGVTELPALLHRYSVTGTVKATLTMPPELADQIPREVSGTLYRIVVEALTNVRRHAPTASQAAVLFVRQGAALTLTVTNDAGSDGAEPITDLDADLRRGGLGLIGLAERVDALGGRLTAGPHGSGGWRVEATFATAKMSDGPLDEKPGARARKKD